MKYVKRFNLCSMILNKENFHFTRVQRSTSLPQTSAMINYNKRRPSCEGMIL